VAKLVSIPASPREVVGKKVSVLRRSGFVPANVYGRNRDSQAVQLDNKELEHLLATHARSQAIAVLVDGKEETAMIASVQRHPTRQHLLHVDFHRISMDEPVQVALTINIIGESPAIRSSDGLLLNNLTEVTVQGLPGDIPSDVNVDISTLEEVDAAIYVRDIVVPDGIEILTDPDEMVVKIIHSTLGEEAAEDATATAAEAPAAESAPEASDEASS
jgi:large subunit ribosomal protein L25